MNNNLTKKLNIILLISAIILFVFCVSVFTLTYLKERREENNLQLEDVEIISCDSKLTQFCTLNTIFSTTGTYNEDYLVYADLPNDEDKPITRKDFVVESNVYDLALKDSQCLRIKQVNVITINDGKVNYEEYPREFITSCEKVEESNINNFSYPLTF